MMCDAGRSSASYPSCTSCEMDSFGWKYANPSIGVEEGMTGYAEFLGAVVDQFKSHAALFGWTYGVGPLADNGFGPDESQVIALVNENPWFPQQTQVTDYSKSFRQEFSSWLRAKYSTTVELQTAWGDPGADLATDQILDPASLFTGPNKSFPDDRIYPWLVTLDDLTAKGRDLFAFRERMKMVEHERYASLIKQKDPNHVLIVEGKPYGELASSKDIDGFRAIVAVRGALDGNQAYDLPLVMAELGKKHGKYTFAVFENWYLGQDEPSEQVPCLAMNGKAARCFGSAFGYVAEMPLANGMRWAPSWGGQADKQSIRDILAYSPTSTCACDFLKPGDTIMGSVTVESFVGSFGVDANAICPGR